MATCGNASAAAVSYSTTFSATEDPISEGGKWVNGETDGLLWSDVQTTGGIACASREVDDGSVSRYADPCAHISTSYLQFDPDQYVQATVSLATDYEDSGANHEIELWVRASIIENSAKGYEVLWNLLGGAAVVRWDGGLGSYTPIDDSLSWGVPADGDVMRVEISGSTLTVKINGATKITTDVTKIGGAYYSTGQPGLGFWPVYPDAVVTSYGWKDFEAGNL